MAPSELPSPKQAVKPTRRPRGKIAHLPRNIREQINFMLSDGLTYAEVIERLGEAAKHLNEDNIGRWHAGPYQKWLKDRAWLEELSSKLDFAVNVLEDPDSPKIREASLAIVLKQMYELIADFEGRLLPFNWLKLLHRLRRGSRTARVPLMGIRRSVTGGLVGALAPFLVIDAMRKGLQAKGVRQVELSWILEDNRPMRHIIEALGARPYKTYRVYEKTLAP